MELSILNLLAVLLVAWLAGNVVSRLGYPAVLGEIGAGIVLGPPLLGLLQAGPPLLVIAELGILLMMVYIGMEIDLRDLGRASYAGLLASIGGFIVPFVLGYAATIAFVGDVWAALFIGMAVGVTSLATKSRILVELGILDTRVAHVMMAGALISDTLALVVFAAIMSAVTVGAVSAAGIGLVLAQIVGFFVVAWLLGVMVVPRLFSWLTARGFGGRTFYLTLALLVALVFAELAELAGLHGILGAFLAGLFLREGIRVKRLSHDITGVVKDVSLGFLAPVFFVTAGFEVSFGVFRDDLFFLVAIVVLATVGKIVGTALFYLPSGHGWREGLTVGAGMNGRGAVEIIIAGIGLQAGIIDQTVFSILVFMAIFTTATVPFLLKWGVDWLRDRGELARTDPSTKPVLIVGAGALARELAQHLSDGSSVTLVDLNARNVALAREEGFEALQGDALDASFLARSGIEECGTLLAVTPNPAVNVLVAQRAREAFMVPTVRAVLRPDSDSGLFAVLEVVGGKPLFGAPIDFSRWDAVAARRRRSELASIEPERARRAVHASDPDLGAHDVLPLFVRRSGALRVFGDLDDVLDDDEVLALVDEEVRPV
jgi:Kef-type K+ transport system membrane component KefB